MMHAVINIKSGAIYFLSSNFSECIIKRDDFNYLYEDNIVEVIPVPMLMLDDFGLQLLEYYKEVKTND